MMTRIVITVEHHPAVDVVSKFRPILSAVLNQMYSVVRWKVEVEE